METRNIKEIHSNVEYQLDKIQNMLENVASEILNWDAWIEFENKKVCLNKEYYSLVVNSLYLLNSNIDHLIPIREILEDYKDIYAYEGFNWRVPKFEDLEPLFKTDFNYPNAINRNQMRFKHGCRGYLLCDDHGMTKRYRVESPRLWAGPAAVFPFLKLEELSFNGIVKFILSNDLKPHGFKLIKELETLIEFNAAYPVIEDENGLCVDREAVRKDIKNEELTYEFKNDIEEIKLDNLEFDKRRADIEVYDEKMLFDVNRGSWDLWESIEYDKLDTEVNINLEETLIARNPRSDIKKNGVVGIDFGTKSTVVVYQEKGNYSVPMRIGAGDYKSKVEAYQYENPTVMEFVDFESFMKLYEGKEGRPKTKWSDLTVSHTARNKMLTSNSEEYYSFFSELKQWCGNSDTKVRIKDKTGLEIELPPFMQLKEDDFNPIEIYAYYIGAYINNMHTGVYMDYSLSFPVTYEWDIREKILDSFRKGIQKSLPKCLNTNEEFMKDFSVEEGANEPAAYAISAMKAYGFNPKADEEIYYGVFDFGGGTTDFDFGVWRKATPKKEERFDYVIEHFGAGGDRYLGGENLLELLSFEVFKDNADLLRENSIAFILPPEVRAFPGSEMLISESKEARLNTRQLMERLRPITEAHDDYKALYSEHEIEVHLYRNQDGKLVTLKLKVNLDEIEEKLSSRIEKGVKDFFEALSDLRDDNKIPTDAKMNILFAGNSSKSERLKILFGKYMREHNTINNFEVFPGLGTKDAYTKQEELGLEVDRTNLELPNSKTGVAFGLVESRRGGVIKVINKEAKCKFFLGVEKLGKFNLVIDKKIELGKWFKFIDASVDKFEIYYTTLAESKTGKLLIDDVDRTRVTIDVISERANVYIRALSFNKIEYVVSYPEDLEKEEYLTEVKNITLV
ncbi:hypothetical protein [uncultured Clostridium sp.]|jgi:hypothetical protein|uniref:hypothetical protein n=1 Tax=uncultured Clostridium sp. TaxID=59620 RepID=UPI0026313ACF|nr:hypothetical protein [uncultured Clostridium sp.]